MQKTAAVKKRSRRCFRLHSIDWRTYIRLVHAFSKQPGVRLAYDSGELEIMSPSLLHDEVGHFLCRIVIVLTQHFMLPIKGGGSTTLKRQLKRKGIEADECFWIRNAPRMAGKRRLNLRTDPPPDLAVEVDVSRSSLNRMAIYAALGVPEVWRWEEDVLTFHALDEEGFHVTETSQNFPGIKPTDLIPFLVKAQTSADDNEVEREFREWLKRT